MFIFHNIREKKNSIFYRLLTHTIHTDNSVHEKCLQWMSVNTNGLQVLNKYCYRNKHNYTLTMMLLIIHFYHCCQQMSMCKIESLPVLLLLLLLLYVYQSVLKEKCFKIQPMPRSYLFTVQCAYMCTWKKPWGTTEIFYLLWKIEIL